MKEARGIVVSTKMKKAVVIRVERIVEHPEYRKFMIRRTRLMARDDIGCKEGDIVDVQNIRPLSRNIRWRVVRVVGRRLAPEAVPEVPA